jgi:hypothetical protein
MQAITLCDQAYQTSRFHYGSKFPAENVTTTKSIFKNGIENFGE